MSLRLMNTRQIVLAVSLFLTLAASAYIGYSDLSAQSNAAPELVADNHIELRHALALQVSPDLGQQLNSRKLSEIGNDIFAVKKAPEPVQKAPEVQAPTAPPSPPVVLPAPTPPPSAPPLPFRYLGKLGEDGQYVVFLSAQNKNYAAKVGDTVAQMYFIDEIKPPTMTVTYLPMKFKQTMPIGEAN